MGCVVFLSNVGLSISNRSDATQCSGGSRKYFSCNTQVSVADLKSLYIVFDGLVKNDYISKRMR